MHTEHHDRLAKEPQIRSAPLEVPREVANEMGMDAAPTLENACGRITWKCCYYPMWAATYTDGVMLFFCRTCGRDLWAVLQDDEADN